MNTEIQHIAIIGGDLHAWTLATGLLLGLGKNIQITVIADIQAEVPGVTCLDLSAHAFHRKLGIQEQALVADFGASYCFGNRYCGFKEHDFTFTYSPVGEILDRINFHDYLSYLKQFDSSVEYANFSIASIAANENKFTHPQPNTAIEHLDYSIQLDRFRYMSFLQSSAKNNGVKHLKASVVSSVRDDVGNIENLQLTNGESIKCDFVFDCVGLISGAEVCVSDQEDALQDLSKTIKQNRELAWVCETKSETKVLRHCQKYPQGYLQRSYLPGLVYHQFFFDEKSNSDAEIMAYLQENIAVIPPGSSIFKQHKPGINLKPWRHNVLAIGKAAAYVGQLLFNELLHTQTALERWLRMYPSKGGNDLLAIEYNRCTVLEYQHVHDVHCLILSADYEQCAETLQYRVSLFENTGRVAFYENDVLEKHQWINLLIESGLWPKRSDPLLNALPLEKLSSRLFEIAAQNKKMAESFPKHDNLLQAIRELPKS